MEDPYLKTVDVSPQSLDRFETVLDEEEYRRFRHVSGQAKQMLDGRTIWNVNSTDRGGGVVELLSSLLPFACGAGVDARWLVVRAEPDFFRLTKRIHNHLHGIAGDGGDLGPKEREFYETTLRPHAERIAAWVGPRDIVLLHDPQTVALAPALRQLGVEVIWRCHVGVDRPNEIVRRAWAFLMPYVEHAGAYVFTRAAYVWEGLRRERVAVIPPSIDVFSAKNQELTVDRVDGILAAAGLTEGEGDASFVRFNGAPGRVVRRVDLSEGAPVPKGAPIVTQVSRWDRLKDPIGVIEGFVSEVAPRSDAHLVVAGPAVGAVSDDPEGGEVLAESRALWRRLAAPLQAKVHVVSLPMDDVEENAAIVNALQRRASVVVQKSLAEGFGLTVAEAMWKTRAIVASRAGGIQDQIQHGVSGLLVDPTDRVAYGSAVASLLADPAMAERLGRAAHERCREEYLAPKHLLRYVELLGAMLT